MHAAADEGMDLDLITGTTPAPSQIEGLLDPMFASFEEELKPLEVNMPTCFDINFHDSVEDFGNPTFDVTPIPVKPEILSEEDIDRWEIPDAVAETNSIFNTLLLNDGIKPNPNLGSTCSGPTNVTPQSYYGSINGTAYSASNTTFAGRSMNGNGSKPYSATINNNTSYAGGRRMNGTSPFFNGGGDLGFSSTNLFRASVVESCGDAKTFTTFSIGTGERYIHWCPYTLRYREIAVGTRRIVTVPQHVLERRQRRMIKNRESAARSRARRLAINVQHKLEIQRLRHENEHLKRVLGGETDFIP